MNATVPERPSVMEELVALSTDRPGEASAEFRFAVGSAPDLADHGLGDMVLLPGASYVEMARCVERALRQRAPRRVRNVSFRRPIVLATEETVVTVDVKERGSGRIEYTFWEAGIENGSGSRAAPQYAARLEIDRSQSSLPETGAEAFSIEAFQARAQAVLDAERFYGMLRDNGNHYGPTFRRICSIWRAGDRSLAKVSVTPHVAAGLNDLHPSVLDSFAQVLASCFLENGKTFVLRSIDSIEITDGALPGTLWAHATIEKRDGDDGSVVGNVRVFDESGKQYVSIDGVALTFLDRVETTDESMSMDLVVAGNFAVEPVEDALRFWEDHFGAVVRLQFAPYDQIFQQLLDTESAFRRNRHGINAVLLSLEEWLARERYAGMTLSEEAAARCFRDRATYVLPNGLKIVHLNRYETDYLYKEIFEDQCYLRHGMRLPDGATVVDIGANIGLFSLFVMSRCRNAQIYAFEPAPVLYELLKANCDAYGANVRAVKAGVSDVAKTAKFTFYERSSVFSGFHADAVEDGEAIRTIVRNTLHSETAVEPDAVEEHVKALTADRLRRTTHECRLMSVSDIIREHQIDKIDLLKIDAEKSEAEIIAGIADCDWPKIEQIVIEIHDPSGAAVERIERYLSAKGYRCAVEHERLLERSGLFNLYATRGEVAGESEDHGSKRALGGLQRNVQDFCAALKGFMHAAPAPLVLCVCPRTPAATANGDLAAALDAAERQLLAEASRIPNVQAIGSTSLIERYALRDCFDPHGHELGAMPYTSEGYAAISTALFRSAFNLKRAPFKVIVLDCDNTLWRGLCGEDGPMAIEVSEPYRRLQEFMIAQLDAGMLLCLCSKNNEKDVFDVFERRPDMVLKREQIVAWRINWSSKSDNLESLARELDLGLDSFIFIDDNPVECADVKINCPEVLTLQLPRDGESIPAFLDHVWAFDHAGTTVEDRARTRMYQENTARRKFRDQVGSLKEFIDGLELRVDVAEATDDELERISQLTFRTNQFNFSTLRRSAGQLKEFLKRKRATGIAIRVTDRFGDYGLVGTVLYESKDDRYSVDTFLLSCRVLGKGVEHAVLAELGRRAVEEDKRYVELAYRATAKNTPVKEFIDNIGGCDANQTSWTAPASRLAALKYDPDQAMRRGREARVPASPVSTAHSQRRWRAGDWSGPLQLIGERLHDIGTLMEAIEKHRLGQDLRVPADIEGSDVLETSLLDIWRKVLGRPGIGVNDNFFDVGGTSLRAVQMLAMIKKQLNRNVSIVSVFEYPTVALLSGKLRTSGAQSADGANTAEAVSRGQRRRKVTRSSAA